MEGESEFRSHLTNDCKQWSGNITAWAPGGIREFPAKVFEAYRRVMPHSEYVSGTSCLFKAMEEYVISGLLVLFRFQLNRLVLERVR